MYIQGSCDNYEDLCHTLKKEIKKRESDGLMLDALLEDLDEEDIENGATILISDVGTIEYFDETEDFRGAIDEEYDDDENLLMIQVNGSGDIFFSFGTVSMIKDSFID